MKARSPLSSTGGAGMQAEIAEVTAITITRFINLPGCRMVASCVKRAATRSGSWSSLHVQDLGLQIKPRALLGAGADGRGKIADAEILRRERIDPSGQQHRALHVGRAEYRGRCDPADVEVSADRLRGDRPADQNRDIAKRPV